MTVFQGAFNLKMIMDKLGYPPPHQPLEHVVEGLTTWEEAHITIIPHHQTHTQGGQGRLGKCAVWGSLRYQ